MFGEMRVPEPTQQHFGDGKLLKATTWHPIPDHCSTPVRGKIPECQGKDRNQCGENVIKKIQRGKKMAQTDDS